MYISYIYIYIERERERNREKFCADDQGREARRQADASARAKNAHRSAQRRTARRVNRDMGSLGSNFPGGGRLLKEFAPRKQDPDRVEFIDMRDLYRTENGRSGLD